MSVLRPVRFARGWLAKPHYKPCFPADIARPTISWYADPHQAGWDEIVEDRQDLLCWAEVDGIFRYGAWSKDPRRRPSHGTYWSSRASEFGRSWAIRDGSAHSALCASHAGKASYPDPAQG